MQEKHIDDILTDRIANSYCALYGIEYIASCEALGLLFANYEFQDFHNYWFPVLSEKIHKYI